MELHGIVKKDLFHPECNPSFQSYNCIAYLDGDVGEVIPYLNSAMGGTVVVRNPPSVTFKAHGRLITVHADRIAINALKSREEADTLLAWLVGEISDTWAQRHRIVPSYASITPPTAVDILKRLPKTNCRKCGQPTCLVFATLVAQGVMGAADCPELDGNSRRQLDAFLSRFPSVES